MFEFPFYVANMEKEFDATVVDDFLKEYLNGRTPNPCVRCNEKVKFADLMDTARELGAGALATGHYVRRVEGPHGAQLHAAADTARAAPASESWACATAK